MCPKGFDFVITSVVALKEVTKEHFGLEKRVGRKRRRKILLNRTNPPANERILTQFLLSKQRWDFLLFHERQIWRDEFPGNGIICVFFFLVQLWEQREIMGTKGDGGDEGDANSWPQYNGGPQNVLDDDEMMMML
jgi:hypothetical protein